MLYSAIVVIPLKMKFFFCVSKKEVQCFEIKNVESIKAKFMPSNNPGGTFLGLKKSNDLHIVKAVGKFINSVILFNLSLISL